MNLCAPALIYVAFSITQIIIDTFKGLYNTAFFKFIVMIVITILLNALCQAGMGIISWVIVFIPFIFMSVIVAILLYVFGLDPATGQLNFKCDNCNERSSNTNKNGNLIYTSTTTTPNNNVKYVNVSYSDSPSSNQINETSETNDKPVTTMWSSDPQYE